MVRSAYGLDKSDEAEATVTVLCPDVVIEKTTTVIYVDERA